VSVKEKADAARRVTTLNGHPSGAMVNEGMGAAESEINALNAAGVFFARVLWGVEKWINGALKEISQLGFFLRQAIID
jgi:succinyl-CoA synthetase alpha subunit